MMRRLAITALLLAAALAAKAQAVPFVAVRTSAKELSMGGAHASGVDLFSGQEAVFQAGVDRVWWQTKSAGYRLTGLQARVNLAPGFALGVSLGSNAMDEMTLYSENGQPLGSFQPNEMVLAMGACFKPVKAIALEAAAKIIRSSLTDSNRARAFAVDLLGSWKISSALTAGIAINNLGQDMDYGYGAYKLPTTCKTGVHCLFTIAGKHSIEAAADLGAMPAYSTLLASAGAGYVYDKSLALRCGAHISSQNDIMPTYYCVGASFLSENFDLSGSYLTAARTFAISLRLKL